jgi:arylsulfatase A-like enzyme
MASPGTNRSSPIKRAETPSRRDFLRLAALTHLASSLTPLIERVGQAPSVSGQAPNVIVLVFDAWSALNLPFYGYRRNTTPNLARFAERATVYHRHYSAGMYTTPGTASLLSGLLPWSHRALQLGTGMASAHRDHQAFAAFHYTHRTVAYAQNEFADVFAGDAGSQVDVHIDSDRFNLSNRLLSGLPLLRNDRLAAYESLDAGILQTLDGKDSSVFLGPVNRLLRLHQRVDADHRFAKEYPFGIPDAGQGLFRMSDLVDGALQILSNLPEPSFTYLHFFPPHGTYRPTAQYAHDFDDGWMPVIKPPHPLTKNPWTPEQVGGSRRLYDQYLESWDHETARLFDFLKASGLFDRSYIVLTADHGDMFERGEIGHLRPLLFDPLVHIPLIIWSPGQTERRDVHTATSSIDVLPTLAHLVGNPIPGWVEGQLLPGLGGVEESDRSILSIEAQRSAAWGPLAQLSLSLTKDNWRLTYYNYPGEWQGFEFYDLDEDPEELYNLHEASPAAAREMQKELLQRLAEANAPYLSPG